MHTAKYDIVNSIDADLGMLGADGTHLWNSNSSTIHIGNMISYTSCTLIALFKGLDSSRLLGGHAALTVSISGGYGSYIHSFNIDQSDINNGQKYVQCGVSPTSSIYGKETTYDLTVGITVVDKNDITVCSSIRSLSFSAFFIAPTYPDPEPKPPAREKPEYDVKFGTLYINNKSMQHNNFSNECTRDEGTMTFKDTIKGKEWEWAKIVIDKKIVYVSTVFARRNVSINDIIQANDTIVTIDKNKYKLKTLIEYNQLCYIINDLTEKGKIDLEYDADTSKYDIPLKDIETSNTSSINEYTACSVNNHYPYIHYNHAIKGKDKNYDTVVLPILEPVENEEEPPKGIDLGVQNAAFGVRYLAKDPDKEQTLTVIEKLNGNIIQTINNFDRSQPGMVKITNELLRPLLIGSVNYIEIDASDGFVTVKQILTFTKGNTPPTITCYCSDELGELEEKPVIEYSVNDIDGDAVTVVEEINDIQTKSFTATLNEKYTAEIPKEFWTKCEYNKNTLRITAIDARGAKDVKEINFTKAKLRTAYTVFYAVDGDLRHEKLFISIDGKEEMRKYTFTNTTYDTGINFDLKDIPEGVEIKAWMVAHNNYATEKYKSSNILTFKKSVYGKPNPKVVLTQDHSEYGYLKLTYDHDDLEFKDNKWISKDPDREPNQFIGNVEIHCYIDGKYEKQYPIENNIIHGGESITYKINFDEISPGSRSHKIQYLVIITDTESNEKNIDIEPGIFNVDNSVLGLQAIEGSHYYNDEPLDPNVNYSNNKYSNNVLEYGFSHIDFIWDGGKDPDGDKCIYNVYIKTPESLNETLKTVSISSRTGPHAIQYNRKYRITEIYNENNEVVGSNVERYDDNNTYKHIQTNKYVGIHIDYLKDSLDKLWPENEKYTIYIEARDVRTWENSYYGFGGEADKGIEYYRRKHAYPNDVQLTIIPNLVDGLGDGEKGRITVLYDHPEITEQSGIVDIYAYQDNQLICKVYSGEFYPKKEQTITIDFSLYEHKLKDIQTSVLKRSKNVTYYAVATDVLGFTSLDRFEGITLEYVPYLIPNEDGTYNLYDVNVNGTIYDFNKDNHYMGPVQKGYHYFNEEPPATTPVEVDPNIIGYESAAIRWPHVVDPDGDEVKYEIYVANSISAYNSEEKEFFNDNQVDDNDYINGEENTHTLVSTKLNYNKVIDIPASVAAEYSQKFEVSLKEYIDDSSVNIWIVSKDPYVNSYYRAGEIINIPKGHEAKAINIAYPRNGSTVYAKQPRILIYLGEDNLQQTTYVQWKEHIYNNRDHTELFSSPPNIKNVTVFKPPEVYTGVSGGKVTFSVWTHNKCTYGPKTYVTYTYKNFFDSFSDEKLIPIKSSHVNAFREAINTTRDAYGLDISKFSRKIEKNMILENFDFNETKQAIIDVNDKINDADSSEGLDYNNPLIVDLKDLDLVEYKGSIAAGSYEEFLEWARLLYVLENL